MDDQDRLRDLAPEDAEELRAFLEKRKWFEQKLAILDAAEPLYPFIRPVLEADPDGTGYRRVGEAEASWRLPTTDRLKTWQRERDELEEEILAFDGGDLGRMKEKTRAITLVPLTRPSTELVEITLVLILLIDKLLTLLRRRCDVLELTRTRLKWDELRWRFRSESVQLQADVDAFLVGRAAGSPQASAKAVESESETPTTHSSRQAPSGIPSTPVRPKNLPDGSNASPSITTPNHADLFASLTRSPSLDFATASPLHRSPGPTSTPGPASTITAFRMRQRRIAHLAERSGQLLDRMIDQATPLVDLGDTSGPSAPSSERAEGAVPDQLLDLQDELEVQIVAIEKKLGLCKSLVKQQEATDVFLRLCAECEDGSREVLERFRAVLKSRPVQDDHAELSALLVRAAESLPRPVDESDFDLLRPSVGQALAARARTMMSRMANARRTASDALTDAEEALAYHVKVHDAWGPVAALEADMGQSVIDMRALSEKLAAACTDLEQLGESSLAIAHQCKEADQVIARADEQLLRFGVAIHRLHHILSAPPRSLTRDADDFTNTQSVRDLDAHFEDVQTELNTLRPLVERAKATEVVGPQLRIAAQGLDGLEDAIAGLTMCLCDEIDASAWDPAAATSTLATDLPEQHERSVARYHQVADALAALEIAPLPSYLVDLGPVLSDLRAKLDASRAPLATAGRLMDLLQAVRQQTHAVLAAQRDADEILSKIASIADGADAAHQAAGLMEEIDIWAAGLSTRIRFVSDHQQSSSPEITSGDSCNRSWPRTDLSELDKRVRVHVNELSARVLAAAQALRSGEGDVGDHGIVSQTKDTDGALDGADSDDESLAPDSPTKATKVLPAPTRIPSLQRGTPRTSGHTATLPESEMPAGLSSPSTPRNLSIDFDADPQERSRTVSDTPTRARSAIPRASLGNGLVDWKSATLRDHRSSRISLPSMTHAAESSRKSTVRQSPIKKRLVQAYISNEKNELDMAVGSIINTLKVDIPIVPVGMNEADEWTDQSGKYWIGTEGRAKLCFCRILRSKTVMVRVGGGWVELSKFLLDHFADAFWQSATDCMAPATPVKGTSAYMASALSSQDLSSSAAKLRRAPSTPASRIPVAIGLGTAKTSSSRIPLPVPQSSQGSSTIPETPTHRSNSTTTPYGSAQPLSLRQSPSINGLSSPLVPLQFLRKASESPPVREREKEKFASPRRSILGRESAPPSPTKPVIRAP